VSELRPVIGLEVHCQLRTASKLFSACPFVPGAEVNRATDPYTWGMPGTLPVVNAAAVELALRLAVALGCDVAAESRWDRKHYFYPDLPKGYQITQRDRPFARGGRLAVPDPEAGPWDSRAIALERIHLEEDAGRIVDGGGVDYGRAGAPLVEVVTAPVIRSAAEAARSLRALRLMLVRLGVSDATMEDGSLRCDANVSLAGPGPGEPGVRCEIKNLNSFKFVEQAIAAEVERQGGLIAAGQPVSPVTLRFDPSRGAVQVMRVKETDLDYRWLPEPDLPSLLIDDAAVAAAAAALPELPELARARYRRLGLSPGEAALLVAEPVLGGYFDAALAALPAVAPERARRLASWLCNELLARVPVEDVGAAKVRPWDLAELVTMLEVGELSGPLAKRLLSLLCAEGGSPRAIAAREGLRLDDDESAVAAAVGEVIRNHPRQVAQYRAGKRALWGFFFGRVIQTLQGRADPQRVRQHLESALTPTSPGDEPP
jgi:aspartyl-tRNA(Asn)/glutamyl-tRNA(Gln) amidotransferase subunit B